MEKIKEFFEEMLGTAGIILYFILGAFISFMPVLMFDLPWFAYTIICLLIMFVFSKIPGFTELSWLIGLIGAINGKQDILAIIYYISCAIIVGSLVYRLIKAFIIEKQ